MSRSNPQITQNPSTLWLEWNGQDGKLKYYDKSLEENVDVDLPFTFLFLDQLSKVSGWNDAAERSIYSNEVKNLNRETLTVRTSGSNVLAQGFYSEIKNDVKAQGGYYLASIYIAYKDDELKIGNIGLKGAALSAWMEFMKKNQKLVHEKAVKMDVHPEIFKKGSIEYRVPKFKVVETTPETDETAKELDKILQEYVEAKPDYTDMPDAPVADEQPPPPEDNELMADIDDDLPF